MIRVSVSMKKVSKNCPIRIVACSRSLGCRSCMERPSWESLGRPTLHISANLFGYGWGKKAGCDKGWSKIMKGTKVN